MCDGLATVIGDLVKVSFSELRVLLGGSPTPVAFNR